MRAGELAAPFSTVGPDTPVAEKAAHLSVGRTLTGLIWLDRVVSS